MCGDCANRPELEVCPQCRMPLDGQISRNRALEELARRTFPKEEEYEDHSGGRQPSCQGHFLCEACLVLEWMIITMMASLVME